MMDERYVHSEDHHCSSSLHDISSIVKIGCALFPKKFIFLDGPFLGRREEKQMPRVDILIEGSMKDIGPDRYDARTTLSLIRGESNIVVDTGNLGQEQQLLRALERFDLAPEEITYVVLTHTCPDHHQNNFLFTRATFIDGTSIYGFGSEYYVWQGREHEIEKGVTVVRLPGHTPYDVAIFVETKEGIVAAAGDLFFWKDDFDYSSRFAWDVEQLKTSREEIEKRADYIIPGHGPLFSTR